MLAMAAALVAAARRDDEKNTEMMAVTHEVWL